MEKKRHIIFDHPFLGGIIASIIAMIGVTWIAGAVAFVGWITGTGSVYLYQIGTSAACLIILWIHKLWFRKDGYKGCFYSSDYDRKEIWRCILLLLIVDIALVIPDYIKEGFKIPPILSFAVALSAGVGEETFFRAIPLSIMIRNNPSNKRIALAVIITSVMFSIVHGINLLAGATLSATIAQLINAFIMGVFFAAIYLRTGSILIPMVYHFIHDALYQFIPSMSESNLVLTAELSAADAIGVIILDIVLIGCVIYLLRKPKWDDIRAVWAKVWPE